MTYTTVCKPGDIFYGRLRVEYKELLKIKIKVANSSKILCGASCGG